MSSTANQAQQGRRQTMMKPLRLLTLSLLWSSCQGTGGPSLRGVLTQASEQQDDRQLNLLTGDTTTTSTGSGGNTIDCSKELSMDISCVGECNFTSRQEGTCESKMFQYHGGPCPSATGAKISSDIAANCRDLHGGPPTSVATGQDVFVVIADAADSNKNSSMWTKVGGFFWTDYRDYPLGLGLSDQQNITFYSSNETSYDNMLQTMLFHAPCELGGTPLAQLPTKDQSVQLFATAIDPKIRVYMELNIRSLKPPQAQPQQQPWQLKSASVTTSVEPAYQELIISDLVQSTAVTTSGTILPLVVEMDPRNDTALTVLSTANLITAAGLECSVHGFYTSNTTSTTGSSSSGGGWP